MILTLAALAAATMQPSFDCARARTQIEHAMCSNDELGALDREEARLYRVALAATPARRQQILAGQREFLEDRDSYCMDSPTMNDCLRDAYLEGIANLRRQSAAGQDRGGLSSGPLRFHCDGGFSDVYVTLFDLPARQAYLSIPAQNEGQPLSVSEDGEGRYIGRYANDMIYEPRGPRVRVGARICTPA
jgi:uncharacterized protein